MRRQRLGVRAASGSGIGRCGAAWAMSVRAGVGDAHILDQRQRHLPAADQLEIDVGEDLAVEQRAVQRAARIVDAVVLAERIERDAGARMLVAGDGDRVDDGIAERRPPAPSRARSSRTARRTARCARSASRRRRTPASRRRSRRSAACREELVAEPVHRNASSVIARSGLMYLWKCRPVGMWLNSSTPPISTTRSPVSGTEAGGFGVDDDLAGHCDPLRVGA